MSQIPKAGVHLIKGNDDDNPDEMMRRYCDEMTTTQGRVVVPNCNRSTRGEEWLAKSNHTIWDEANNASDAEFSSHFVSGYDPWEGQEEEDYNEDTNASALGANTGSAAGVSESAGSSYMGHFAKATKQLRASAVAGEEGGDKQTYRDAMVNGSADDLRAVLRDTANVNAHQELQERGHGGFCAPMSWAAQMGKVDHVRALLEAGACPRGCPSSFSPTETVWFDGRRTKMVPAFSWMVADSTKDEEKAAIARLLIAAGADPHAPVADGYGGYPDGYGTYETPAEAAAKKGLVRLEAVLQLASAGRQAGQVGDRVGERPRPAPARPRRTAQQRSAEGHGKARWVTARRSLRATTL